MIFGHQKNLKIFSRYLKENRFPHGVLFTGPSKIGKRRAAIEITKYLEAPHTENFLDFAQKDCCCQTCQLIENGNFPDLYEVKGEEEILIKGIREIRQKIALTSFSPYKIIIINNAENISSEAAGAFLKTLEEPKGKTIFFLLSSKPNLLLRTIISRVEIFKFKPFSKEVIRKFLKKSGFQSESVIVDFSFGRPGLAQELSIDKSKILYYNSLVKLIEKLEKFSIIERLKTAEKVEKQKDLDDFLFLLGVWFEDMFLLKNGVSKISLEFKEEKIKEMGKNFYEERLKKIIQEIQQTKKYLLFSNVNRLLALENLLLAI